MEIELGLLTDEIILQAPTREKPYTIRDGRGLFVLVHPNGSRYFQMRATVGGRRKLMQLGVYPQISIDAARTLSADRLQEELFQSESGIPIGTQDESGSLFMDDTYEIKAAPIDRPTEMEEDTTMMLDEDEVDFFEDRPNVPTPKVSLAYDQLVYIPKTLPKTFSQKFAARFHPKVLLNLLVANAISKLNTLKITLSALGQRLLNWFKESIYSFCAKLGNSIRYSLNQLKKLLSGIKVELYKVKAKVLSFQLKKASMVSVGLALPDEVKVSPTEDKLSAVDRRALALIGPSKEIVGALLLSYQKLYMQLQSKLVQYSEVLRSIIKDEQAADRRDVIAVYGLFAERKGNYLIFIIKSLIASVLVKKG